MEEVGSLIVLILRKGFISKMIMQPLACACVQRYTCTCNVLCTTMFFISLGYKLYVLLEKLGVSERGCSNLGGRLCADSCLAVFIILREHKTYFLNL